MSVKTYTLFGPPQTGFLVDKGDIKYRKLGECRAAVTSVNDNGAYSLWDWPYGDSIAIPTAKYVKLLLDERDGETAAQQIKRVYGFHL